jgi:xylulokinase
MPDLAPAASDCILAVDLGSGGPKVALVRADGQILAHAKRSIATHFVGNGGVEQDPQEWYLAIRDAAREVLSKGLVPIEQILAVSGTGQWSVTVPVDQDGKPLMRAVHWLDTRGAPYTHALTRGWIKVAGYGLTRLLGWLQLTRGVPTHSGADVLAHILFLKHQRPEIYRAAFKLLEPIDYLNLQLCGRACASYASVFPYLLTDNRDPRHIDYAPRLLRWSGVDRQKLPDLIPVQSVVGTIRPEMAAEWGLAPGTKIISSTGDSQAAVLGSGAVADLDAHICIGTSSWMTCHVPWGKTDIFRYLATMPAALSGRNMVVAELLAAGKCVEQMVERWFFPGPLAADPDVAYAEFEQLAESVAPGSDGLIFLPWLNGAGPPTGDPQARGGFVNQSLLTTRAHACRAVLEGVSYNMRWLLGAFERFIGREVPSLRFIGGGARMNVWCQILADVLDRPIHQVAEPTLAIVRGAGFSGWLALGRLQAEDIPGCVQVDRTFTPRSQYRQRYDELFAAFLRYYQVQKPILARLQAAAR